MISIDKFKEVVKNTPLISIDFIIKNSENKILLGKRTNEPALGYWFVPGGRIYKNEYISSAKKRILYNELNLEISKVKFIGYFEHFYTTSFISKDIDTHYVVLAFEINYNIMIDYLPKNQHNEYRYFSIDELIKNNEVHINTKNYFTKGIDVK